MTSRSYYALEHSDRFRGLTEVASNFDYIQQQQRNIAMSVSHGGHQDVRYQPLTRHGRQPPPRQAETPTASGQQRRRIAVACGRCRKRKIKCSGDPGDGSGCQNCQQAAGEINNCQFRRVGSVEFPAAGLMENTSARLGGYGPSTSQLMATSVPQPLAWPGYSRGCPVTPTPRTYANSWTSYSDDAQHDTCYYQPQVSVAGQVPIGNLINDHQHGSQHGGRGNGLFMEQQCTGEPYGMSGLPYLNTSIQRQHVANSSTDSLSPGPFGMTSLQSSLPVTSAPFSSDRQLPIPTLSRTQTASNLELPLRPFTNRSTMSNIDTSVASNRSAIPWTSINTSADDSNAIHSTAASMTSSAPRYSTTEGGAFSYAAVSGGPEYSPASAPSLTYSATSTASSASSGADRYSGTSSLLLPAIPASEETLTHSDSSQNLYSFSAEAPSKRNSIGEPGSSEGTLVSGQRYTPLDQPQAHRVPDYKILHDSTDQRSIPAHRMSTSDLRNRSC